jgi:hypothetical protein
VFGFFAQTLGLAGGFDVKAVGDTDGNLGVMICFAGGMAVGLGGGGGVAVTGTLAAGSIYDMEGLSFEIEGGGGHGVLAEGSAGGFVGNESVGVQGSRGAGLGEGFYVSPQAVGCKLMLSARVF